jgi:pyridoxine 5-phosphate synthase
MTLLSVNVNKIALLRNSRGTNYPDLLYFVQKIIGRGVQGITVHPRPDERHITRQDARDIAALLKNHPGVEFNIEGYPTDGFMAMIEDLRPAQCTLVPDEPGQLTSDHGWDVTGNRKLLSEVLAQLRSWQVRSSLFLDPVPGLVNDVQSVGADRIELYTEHYARVHAQGSKQRLAETLQQYHGTARVARDAGIGVNAGHDLNLDNLADLLAGGLIQEVSIGHALIVESLEQGMDIVLDRYLAITRHAD